MKKSVLLVVGILGMCALIANYRQQTAGESPVITIGFAGDTMLGRSVSDFLMRMPEHVRYRYPWGNILSYLQKNDVNIINLETTLTKSTHIRPKAFNYKADPDLVKALQIAEIDVVNIANNHILDFDYEGLFETIATLQGADILPVGAGKNIQEASKPAIITKKGIQLGIIGYTDNEPDWQAGVEHPGTNYLRVGNIEKVRFDLEKLRDHVDVIIVTIQWGPNKQERPSQEFQDFAHAIIDAGADIIHGHSAHLVQGVEIYKNKLIMYDTGDFVDDYAIYEDLRNDLGFLFQVTVDTKGPLSLKLIPTAISAMQVNVATGANKDHIQERMKKLCNEMGTHINEQGTIALR